ncbi:hypothetical protein MKX03_028330 [Papaver bracteatum]|nr:hypothetical protein MKX03_028330 [Papaver bracteatum]
MGTIRSHGNVIFSLLLLFSVLVTKGWSYRVRVHVQNNLEAKEVLFIHCKSNYDDLGERVLRVGEESYWNFQVFAVYTHFWCDFRWYDSWNQHWYSGTFDVYQANGLVNRYIDYCRHKCMYSARQLGFYLYRIDQQKWEKRNEWLAE